MPFKKAGSLTQRLHKVRKKIRNFIKNAIGLGPWESLLGERLFPADERPFGHADMPFLKDFWPNRIALERSGSYAKGYYRRWN